MIKNFENYFVPKKNKTFFRHQFFTRNQQSGETIDQFVTDLKNKSKDCAFGTLREELIKDRLVCGILDTHMKERLLRVDDLTLDPALDIICCEKEKELSRLEKLKDVEKEENIQSVLTFDLQAVLPVPCGENSMLYYRRKLSCYNFTVYNIIDKKGYSYFWHEELGRRGANEIGSCVYNFLKEESANLKEDVVFYSDNCVGQNKNKFLFSLYVHCVMNLKYNSITHKYLVAGHTQNEGDHMHSLIEREKKLMMNRGPIVHPSQWTTIIQLSKKTGQPFKVKEIDTSDIFNLKLLTKKIGTNFTMNEEKEKVLWHDVCCVRVEKECPSIILYQTSYEQEGWMRLNIMGRARRLDRRTNCELVPAYADRPGIPVCKKKDLLDLCDAHVIPRVHWDFFKNLKVDESNLNVEDDG